MTATFWHQSWPSAWHEAHLCSSVSLAALPGTVFAYGQTGCGKTHTMEGGERNDVGVIPRSFLHIFGRIAKGAPRDAVACSRCPCVPKKVLMILVMRLQFGVRPDIVPSLEATNSSGCASAPDTVDSGQTLYVV